MPHHPGVSVLLSDVAREAGVSLATASRALNGSVRQVRPDLASRVQAAAEQLGYTANAQAQAVARGTSTVVGLLVNDISDPYFSAIASAIERRAQDAGLLIVLASTHGDPEVERGYVNLLRGQRARAIVLVGSRSSGARSAALKRELTSFRESGGRVVAVSQPLLGVDTVVVANREGARELATALVGRGYERFAVLAGPPTLLTARDRCRGFVEGVSNAGLPAPVVVHGSFDRDGGYAAMDELLTARTTVDAVFAVNDVMAVGAMSAARAATVRVPQDLALAGFDDIATLRDVHPGLTTVRLPLEELGDRAMELALAESSGVARTAVSGEVVLRESTPARRR